MYTLSLDKIFICVMTLRKWMGVELFCLISLQDDGWRMQIRVEPLVPPSTLFPVQASEHYQSTYHDYTCVVYSLKLTIDSNQQSLAFLPHQSVLCRMMVGECKLESNHRCRLPLYFLSRPRNTIRVRAMITLAVFKA